MLQLCSNVIKLLIELLHIEFSLALDLGEFLLHSGSYTINYGVGIRALMPMLLRENFQFVDPFARYIPRFLVHSFLTFLQLPTT